MSRETYTSKSALVARGYDVDPQQQQQQAEVVTRGSKSAGARSNERVFSDDTSPRADLRLDSDERHGSSDGTGIASPQPTADAPAPPRGFWDRFAGEPPRFSLAAMRHEWCGVWDRICAAVV